MREHEQELARRDVAVLVVTFETDFLARAYVEDTDLRWPVLVDETRELYHAYGMLTASSWEVWSPRTLWAYGRLLLSGRRLRASEGDVSQRGGDVLVDPGGLVRLHHVGEGPADRPPVSELLERILAG